MKCSECKKDTRFLKWFVNAYRCDSCKKKTASEDKTIGVNIILFVSIIIVIINIAKLGLHDFLTHPMALVLLTLMLGSIIYKKKNKERK